MMRSWIAAITSPDSISPRCPLEINHRPVVHLKSFETLAGNRIADSEHPVSDAIRSDIGRALIMSHGPASS
jgi:hypothetical protein